MIRCISIILFTCCFLHVRAQERITIEEYVARFRDIAVSEMKRSGVPAAITLAQGILESENGNSELVKKSNNHFGIKCKSTWAGDSVNHDDDAEGECFRAYANAEDSYRDHSNFLKGNQRYASLFNLNPEDYKAWARGLKKAGYATNPRYPDLLIKYIEQYNLQQYTLVALNKMTAPDMMAADTMRSATPAETVSNPSTPTNTESIPADAGRIISINKIKCVYAARGTSLLALATKHNINLNRLMDFNDLTEEGLLQKDQYIFLQKKSRTGEKEFYVVQQGETLHDVAQKNGIQLQALREYNNLDKTAPIPASTKLYLQPGLNKQHAEQQKVKTHKVEPKEGLYAIARKYQVTVQQLREWNKLGSDELKIGQELIVGK
ncbi:MAG TPA: LysM peptidoglycan-binding domain-containing protein [Ferruginibacter sp.]|nr:LysM peptidoglycan-binding domain-containing protein [Ferruginibacter sp.]HNA15841.1 LysM peptidoglycan-binding domain-containing protein [Ferruginibacter sp.]